MIDHVSIGVRDLGASSRFYETVLGTIGYEKLIVGEHTVGFGKRHPEFWLNSRPDMVPAPAETGAHVCLRARSADLVDAFHKAALDAGGGEDGAPGPRPEYAEAYYAAFIRDPDGNRVEVVTFLTLQ